MRCDTIWTDARLATMTQGMSGLDEIEDGMVAADGGRIVYAGSVADAPALEAAETVTCDGRWITPGLIDCHTHLVYAGNRAAEFEQRLAGADYEDIAKAGGGILSTVRATRAASREQLVADSRPRLADLVAEGVTTVEIKSGYGLTLADESKQLEAARALGEAMDCRVATTFLGMHSLPPEFTDDTDGYAAHVCEEMLPAIAEAGLADAVDIFCETIGFTAAQTQRLFEASTALGLPVKIHAEQLSDSGGAALAAGFDALSADHLEYAGETAVAAMAESGTAAVLLPGAFYFLRETKLPPVELLRAHGVPISVATDCNPGTSPLTSLLLTMNMAATLFRLTVEECLTGVTRNAAGALGLSDEIGTLEAGKACDLAIWDVERPAELVYAIGANPLHQRIRNGR
ncbi:imidazolonepropionase [Parasphingopyxis sp.]|uniref:imidazolonepropionase n=1 Tax=Parasphingopyxis sp. TaxID=1920299 RepID=UPI00263881B2|nr:imidazolonepropionase [Parasphingopyxis sp.]